MQLPCQLPPATCDASSITSCHGHESDAMRVTLLLVRLESEQEWTETASHMQERTGSSAIHHLPGIQCLAVPGAFYSLVLVILKACFPFISNGLLQG